MVDLARASEGAELQALRSRADIAGLRLEQLGKGERTGAVELPVERLLPLVADGTSAEALGRLLRGEVGDSGGQSGTGAADNGHMERRRVKAKFRTGDIVFFNGEVVPHVVTGVELRELQVAEESPKWLVVSPLPFVAGEQLPAAHASEFELLKQATLTAAWEAACSLSDGEDRQRRRLALADAVAREAANRSKAPKELWATLCVGHRCPPELTGVFEAGDQVWLGSFARQAARVVRSTAEVYSGKTYMRYRIKIDDSGDEVEVDGAELFLRA